MAHLQSPDRARGARLAADRCRIACHILGALYAGFPSESSWRFCPETGKAWVGLRARDGGDVSCWWVPVLG